MANREDTVTSGSALHSSATGFRSAKYTDFPKAFKHQLLGSPTSCNSSAAQPKIGARVCPSSYSSKRRPQTLSLEHFTNLYGRLVGLYGTVIVYGTPAVGICAGMYYNI